MSNKANKQILIKVPDVLKILGIICGTLAIIIILLSILAYLPEHPNFSIFTTYLSDIGDTPGWPQIIFNSGTLISAPLRFLIIVLVILRLSELGAGKTFAITALIFGFLSTSGTIAMTATPFSIAPAIHKAGIGLYFLGVVVLQTVIFIKEVTLKNVPKILPVLSIFMVFVFFVFALLMMLYEKGMVDRNTPVIWEWIAILSSIIWVYAHSIVLGGNKKNM
ncbi:MAG: Frag1/DRAM/Sfk1 family protein [Actinobacteria bacterium]|nr:Frag1/DRAM/Sfk1 family protein [Actinomycetota bacterium]